MEPTQIQIPATSKYVTEADQCLIAIRDQYKCTTDEQLNQCQLLFKFIKARQKEIKADLDKDLEPVIEKLHKMHKDAVSLRNQALDSWSKAETAIETVMRPYVQKKLVEEAAEKRRLQEEADRKAKEEQELAALEAMIDGAVDEAQIIQDLPAVAKKVKIQSTAKQVEGVGIKQPWSWKVIDEKLIPDEYWVVDWKKINAEVRDKKEKTNIPGIKAFQDVTFSG